MSKAMISQTEKVFAKISDLDKLALAKKYPQLGLQLPNAGGDKKV